MSIELTIFCTCWSFGLTIPQKFLTWLDSHWSLLYCLAVLRTNHPQNHARCWSFVVVCYHTFCLHFTVLQWQWSNLENVGLISLEVITSAWVSALQWRHNGHDDVSNHQPHDCLLNRLFRCRSKKTSKLRVTGLCVGNSPVTGEFPAQMASNAENVSIWWRHHGMGMLVSLVFTRGQFWPSGIVVGCVCLSVRLCVR